jgi:hypothetical protein
MYYVNPMHSVAHVMDICAWHIMHITTTQDSSVYIVILVSTVSEFEGSLHVVVHCVDFFVLGVHGRHVVYYFCPYPKPVNAVLWLGDTGMCEQFVVRTAEFESQ